MTVLTKVKLHGVERDLGPERIQFNSMYLSSLSGPSPHPFSIPNLLLS